MYRSPRHHPMDSNRPNEFSHPTPPDKPTKRPRDEHAVVAGRRTSNGEVSTSAATEQPTLYTHSTTYPTTSTPAAYTHATLETLAAVATSLLELRHAETRGRPSTAGVVSEAVKAKPPVVVVQPQPRRQPSTDVEKAGRKRVVAKAAEGVEVDGRRVEKVGRDAQTASSSSQTSRTSHTIITSLPQIPPISPPRRSPRHHSTSTSSTRTQPTYPPLLKPTPRAATDSECGEVLRRVFEDVTAAAVPHPSTTKQQQQRQRLGDPRQARKDAGQVLRSAASTARSLPSQRPPSPPPGNSRAETSAYPPPTTTPPPHPHPHPKRRTSLKDPRPAQRARRAASPSPSQSSAVPHVDESRDSVAYTPGRGEPDSRGVKGPRRVSTGVSSLPRLRPELRARLKAFDAFVWRYESLYGQVKSDTHLKSQAPNVLITYLICQRSAHARNGGRAPPPPPRLRMPPRPAHRGGNSASSVSSTVSARPVSGPTHANGNPRGASATTAQGRDDAKTATITTAPAPLHPLGDLRSSSSGSRSVSVQGPMEYAARPNHEHVYPYSDWKNGYHDPPPPQHSLSWSPPPGATYPHHQHQTQQQSRQAYPSATPSSSSPAAAAFYTTYPPPTTYEQDPRYTQHAFYPPPMMYADGYTRYPRESYGYPAHPQTLSTHPPTHTHPHAHPPPPHVHPHRPAPDMYPPATYTHPHFQHYPPNQHPRRPHPSYPSHDTTAYPSVPPQTHLQSDGTLTSAGTWTGPSPPPGYHDPRVDTHPPPDPPPDSNRKQDRPTHDGQDHRRDEYTAPVTIPPHGYHTLEYHRPYPYPHQQPYVHYPPGDPAGMMGFHHPRGGV
ncbi:uncharacterized protein EV422DRAFT_370234 [Fimicolochytrium jonesii]|uniref:uncharacterized protein n=1 Tax=Fimicolochytrium jonesii TaxID=1396493 RepID=UPI0022FDCB26|nr:uncharacterized protein EV422DRAFT_370234 [Fimicolochytrium jonesii]KAI8815570.1 hypothetical protein EV422DRAFT_370234 [Fimicolochytrium jonesii]